MFISYIYDHGNNHLGNVRQNEIMEVILERQSYTEVKCKHLMTIASTREMTLLWIQLPVILMNH